MVMQQKQEYASIGKTQPVPNHVHDLIHELSDRIDAVWRYDQYIENAQGMQDLEECWQQIKQEDEQHCHKLKGLLVRYLQGGMVQPGGRMGQANQTASAQGAARGSGDRPI